MAAPARHLPWLRLHPGECRRRRPGARLVAGRSLWAGSGVHIRELAPRRSPRAWAEFPPAHLEKSGEHIAVSVWNPQGLYAVTDPDLLSGDRLYQAVEAA